MLSRYRPPAWTVQRTATMVVGVPTASRAGSSIAPQEQKRGFPSFRWQREPVSVRCRAYFEAVTSHSWRSSTGTGERVRRGSFMQPSWGTGGDEIGADRVAVDEIGARNVAVVATGAHVIGVRGRQVLPFWP